MGFIGKQPTPVPLTASDITDGIITSAKIADGTIATADIADDAVTAAKASGITSEPFRNILINGDMNINQRGTVTGINTNTYTLDRWITEGDDATITVSQDSTVPTGMGFRNSLKIAVTTANSSVAADEEQKIGQRIEGRMLQTLKYGTSSATTATLSFWVRSNVTGTYAIQFQDDDNDKVQTKTYSISSADTWEKKTVTIAANTSNTLDNDSNRSFRILWWLTAGSNYTADASSSGAWTARSSNIDTIAYGHNVNVMSSTSNTFYMTGCQFEIGSTASDFEFLPHDVNLLRCQRYYYLHSDSVATNKPLGVGFYYSSSYLGIAVHYTTTMRTTPSVMSPNATDYFKIDRNGGNDTFNSIALEIGSQNAMYCYNASQVSGTGGQSGYVRTNNASSYLAFDAEI